MCVYCAEAVLSGHEKPEHPVPASLGASLIVDTVCDACNEWAGREVDQPFLTDALLRCYRSAVDQRDPRRGKKARRVSAPLLRGFTLDGDYIAFDHDSGRPVMRSRIVDLGEGRFQIRAGSEVEAERLMSKLRERAAREDKQATLESREVRQDHPRIEGRIVVRMGVWRREAAKIGLAVGSLVYPPSWRHSDDAYRLREWMRDRDPSTDDGKAPPLVPSSPPGGGVSLARGDEHLLFFMRLRDGATYLFVILFGEACFAVPVDTAGGSVPHQAWRLEWRNPDRDGVTTWDDLVLDVALRS